MGKYSLIVSLAVLGAISLLAYQGDLTSLDTSERQSRREGNVIARQIARTGYNAVLSKARQEDDSTKTVTQVVSDVDTLRGQYEGGVYEAWLEKVSSTAFKAVSVGRFEIGDRVLKHEIGRGYSDNKMVKAPEVDVPSSLQVDFEQSQAGYCSAVYLKRVLPGTEPADQPEPEMIFSPGNDRNDSTATYDQTIDAGTKLNFILAVDKDCSHEGNESATYPDDYDHTQLSFEQDVEDLKTMREAPFGMVEEATFGSAEGWRVSFEDQRVFTESQLWDIKENGYPDGSSPDDGDWNSEDETYGGDGWETNSDGLQQLEDYGSIPDFSDQVIQVSLQDPVS